MAKIIHFWVKSYKLQQVFETNKGSPQNDLSKHPGLLLE